LDRHPEFRGRIRILVLEYAQSAKRQKFPAVHYEAETEAVIDKLVEGKGGRI